MRPAISNLSSDHQISFGIKYCPPDGEILREPPEQVEGKLAGAGPSATLRASLAQGKLFLLRAGGGK